MVKALLQIKGYRYDIKSSKEIIAIKLDGEEMMEAEIKIIVDEERGLERIKAAIGKMKVKRNLRVVSILIIPLLIDTCIQLWRYRCNFGMFLLQAIMGIAEVFLFWFCLWGNELRLMHQTKKQMKKINYPFEQILSFDEKEVEIRSENQRKRLCWDSIETVCEDEKYWFLGCEGLVIEKELLTQEQYEFVKRKCNAVKRHSKWI